MDYENLCATIFRIDPKIRFVGVYHKDGELLNGGMRGGLEPYLPREERARSTRHTIMRWETRKILFPFIGEGKYSMTEYEKIKRMTFPLSESALLLITTEISANHNFIIDKIQQIVTENLAQSEVF